MALNETNQGPTAVSLINTVSTLSEASDTSSRTRIADIEITDDGAGTNVVSLAGTDADQFEVVGSSLYLRADRSLDYETQSSYGITVQVADPNVGGPVTTSMTLGISDANDAPTGVAFQNAVNLLSDRTDTSSRVRVADIQVTDDALGTNTLSLSGDDTADFELVGSSLYLRAGTTLDIDIKPTYHVSVSAVDTELGSAPISAPFSLTVSEVNYAPTAVSLINTVSTLSEASDTSSRTRIADIEITDDGAGTNVVSLAGTDADQFEVVGSSLYLRADRSLDYETQSSYGITVQVADPNVGGPVTTSMTLGISDANDAPTGVSLVNAIASLSEDTDTSSRVRVADIQVTDDALGTNTLSLSGVDAVDFELVGSSLYLRAGTELDSEAKSNYSVNISAVDPSTGGNPVSITMDLEIAPPGSTNMIVVPYDPSADLINGGSFDNTPVGGRSWNRRLRYGVVPSVPGWSNANQIEAWDHSFARIIVGERAGDDNRGLILELDKDAGGNLDWIQQSISTEEGAQYLILIDALSRSGDGASDDFELHWNNQAFSTVSTDAMRGESWQTFGGLVTGTGESDALRIIETAAGNDGLGPLIDNVRAYRYESGTPSVDEHMPAQTPVTHILVNMLDGTSYTNLRLAEDGGGRFALDTDSGMITTTRSLDYDTDPSSYRLTVAVDTDGGTHLQYLNVALNETNQGPTAVSLTNTVSTLSEASDTSSRTRIADIEITDDGAGTNVVSLAGTDADQFEVVGSSLYLRADRSLDYETQSSYGITVQVADPNVGGPVTTSMTLGISDANDAPTGVSLVNAIASLSEDTDTSSRVRVADIQVTDDALGTNTLSLSGVDAVDFELVGSSLYLRAGTELDSEAKSNYSVNISAVDPSTGGNPVSTTMDLEIAPPGSTNMIVVPYDPSADLINGGSFDNTPVGGRSWNRRLRYGVVPSVPGWSNANQIEAWDHSFARIIVGERAGDDNRGLILELDKDAGGNLDWIQQSISTEEGAQYLILIDALSRSGDGASDDFELHWNNQAFSTVSTDAMRGESWQTFGGLVTGTGESDALRIIETAAGNDGLGPLIDNVRAYRYESGTPSVDEHMPAQTPVTHILVNMLDGTSYTNLRLAEDGGGRFALDTDSGMITTTRSLDYDTDPSSYRLTVAVDTDGGTHLQYLNVALNETNQGPTAVSLTNTVSTLSEASDTSSRTRIADIEITDDGAGTNVVSLAGTDADQFEVVGSSLYLRADRSLDYETQSSYGITVQVADPNVGGPVSAEATLLVDDLDEILDSLTSDWSEAYPHDSSGSLDDPWDSWD